MGDLIEGSSSICHTHYAQGMYSSVDNSFQGIEEQYNAIKFPEREKELLRMKKEIDEENAAQLERQRRRHQERVDYDNRQSQHQNEIVRYRDELKKREDELIKKIERRESDMIYLGGPSHGRYIITSAVKVRQG